MSDAVQLAERGAALYGANCAGCHGDAGQGGNAPAVVGQGALPLDPRAGSKRTTQFKTARDVFEFVRTAMPPKAPGSLPDDDYRAIVAFDLKANGVDLTGKTLTDEGLASIALH